MKKLILSSMIAAAAAIPALAGVNNVNYQAVIKNGNEVVANKEVAMKFELLSDGEAVWSQEQKPTTNAAGLVSCQLGEGIEAVDFNGDLTLQVSIDLGNGFQVISNEAVASVPSALRSADAQELYPVVIELMEENENTKETLLGVNAQLAQFEGFVEEVSDFHERVNEALLNLNELTESYDQFNQRVSEELQKLIGLDYEELGDFNQRVSDRIAYLSEVLETIEGTDYANMVTELNAKLEELKSYSAKIQEIEDFNNRLSEELEPMVGLNYEEINDFHQRVSETLTDLNEKADAMDEFNQSVSDALAPLQGLNYEEVNDFHQRVSEELVQLNEDRETLADVVKEVEGLVKDNEETQSNLKNISADVAQIEGLAKKVESIEEELDYTNDDSILANIMKMGEGFATAEENIDSNTSKIKALEDKITDLEDELDTLRGYIQHLMEQQGEDVPTVRPEL